jgi:hypothetical protein
MATDIKKIIDNLLGFYDFKNQTVITVAQEEDCLIELQNIETN